MSDIVETIEPKGSEEPGRLRNELYARYDIRNNNNNNDLYVKLFVSSCVELLKDYLLSRRRKKKK